MPIHGRQAQTGNVATISSVSSRSGESTPGGACALASAVAVAVGATATANALTMWNHPASPSIDPTIPATVPGDQSEWA